MRKQSRKHSALWVAIMFSTYPWVLVWGCHRGFQQHLVSSPSLPHWDHSWDHKLTLSPNRCLGFMAVVPGPWTATGWILFILPLKSQVLICSAIRLAVHMALRAGFLSLAHPSVPSEPGGWKCAQTHASLAKPKPRAVSSLSARFLPSSSCCPHLTLPSDNRNDPSSCWSSGWVLGLSLLPPWLYSLAALWQTSPSTAPMT